jgi:hypothetical protein
VNIPNPHGAGQMACEIYDVCSCHWSSVSSTDGDGHVRVCPGTHGRWSRSAVCQELEPWHAADGEGKVREKQTGSPYTVAVVVLTTVVLLAGEYATSVCGTYQAQWLSCPEP